MRGGAPAVSGAEGEGTEKWRAHAHVRQWWQWRPFGPGRKKIERGSLARLAKG
jgi:hypothetical protein